MTTDERLEKLEKELIRTKRHNHWLLATAGLVVLSLFLAKIFLGTEHSAYAQGQGTEKKVIHANTFILEDENGKMRATLAMEKNGPQLALFDEKREPRAVLAAPDDGPRIVLTDEKGNIRAWLMVIGEGSGLVLTNEKAKGGVELVVRKDSPALSMTDDKGKTLWSAP